MVNARASVSQADPSRSVLWVDDYPLSVRPIASELEARGWAVKIVETFDGFSAQELSNFEYFVFDNKIKQKMNQGIKFAKELGLSHYCHILLFSANIDHSLLLQREKIFDATGARLFYYGRSNPQIGYSKEWRRQIATDIERFFTDEEAVIKEQKAELEEISYSEYLSLSPEEKAALYDDFESKHRPKLTDAFERGAVWVLGFSGDDELDRVLFNSQEVPESREVTDLAQKKGMAPFVFDRRYGFDDTPLHCQPNTPRDLSTYPYLAANVGQRLEEFHYDTGADSCLFGIKFLTEMGAGTFILDKKVPIQDKDHLVSEVDVEIIFKDCFASFPPLEEQRQAPTGIVISALAVNDWENCRLYVECNPLLCTAQSGGHAGCTRRRNGLLGRNIMEDPSVIAVVTATSGASALIVAPTSKQGDSNS
ncbi:MAG: hypothetical protein ACE360_11255 [Hyphomicrobiales bacterium]